jgi:catechol 2,3-dioxygenase-like lactoylglutathione lyase family enzyme
MPMRRLAATLLSGFLVFHVVPLRAQLGPPNSTGVSIGHVQLTVRDPEQHKKLWGLLGAVVTHSGSLELLRFPGIYIVLTPGETTEGSEGSTVNHFGFAVKNVDDIHARLGAAGLPTVQELTNPRRWVTMFPDKIKIEFTEDPTLSVPIVGHHLHLSTTAANMETLRTWYVKTFGGIAETRRGFSSAVFNGGEINFLPANAPQASTKGRALDHIGFEVQGLDAFCKKLQAAGIMFETPYREVPQYGLKVAFITDPDGTRIELTEGLAGLRP